MPPTLDGSRRRDLLAVRVLAVTVASLAVLVLVGWFGDITWLTSLAPETDTVKPNTAVCLLLLSGSLLLARAGWIPAVIVLVVAALSLLSVSRPIGLPLDDLVLQVGAPGPHPGRMAVTTMICLILLSLSRLAVRRAAAAAQVAAQVAAGVVLGLSIVALLGHAYGVTALYSTGRWSTMAPATATALLLIAVALLVLRPTGPVQWLLHGDDAGALLMRRLLPLVLLVVPVLAWVPLLGGHTGWFDTGTGLAIMVTVCLAVVVGAILFVARRLAEHDRKLIQAVSTLSVVNRDLEARVTRRATELEQERGRSAVLRDRNRIAADLHDHVIQTLFALALQLQAEARRSDRPEPLVEASAHVDQAIRGLRSTIFELKRAGSAQQLESDLAEVVAYAGHTDAEVELRTVGQLATLSDEIAEHVLAAAREGLSNAVKHAAAQLITLEVDVRGEDLLLVVADDGIGVDPADATSGMHNLQQRAVRLGGSCEWTRNETGGTTLSWRVPRSVTTGLASGLVATATEATSDTLPAAVAAVCAAVHSGPTALQEVTGSIRAALDADLALVVAGDGPDRVRILSSLGLPDDDRAIGQVMDRNLSASGHAINTGQVLRLDNVTGVPIPSRLFGSLPFTSGLVVPVLGYDGGATLVVARATRAFTDLEEHHALALGSLLPLVLDHDGAHDGAHDCAHECAHDGDRAEVHTAG